MLLYNYFCYFYVDINNLQTWRGTVFLDAQLKERWVTIYKVSSVSLQNMVSHGLPQLLVFVDSVIHTPLWHLSLWYLFFHPFVQICQVDLNAFFPLLLLPLICLIISALQLLLLLVVNIKTTMHIHLSPWQVVNKSCQFYNLYPLSTFTFILYLSFLLYVICKFWQSIFLSQSFLLMIWKIIKSVRKCKIPYYDL